MEPDVRYVNVTAVARMASKGVVGGARASRKRGAGRN